MSGSFDVLPELGVGLVYWPELEPLLKQEGLVNVIEVEPQALWYELDRPTVPYLADPEVLQRLQSLPHPKLIHSVGIPIGGSRSPVTRQLPLLQQIVKDLDAVWASEHLSFNHAAVLDRLSPTGFLLPPLQTTAGVSTAVQAIRKIANSLPIPFAVETGVSYLQPRSGELSDGQFVAAVANEAACGILLDLHNLWTNERNGRQSVQAFLSDIPLDRVIEIHLAGGCEYDGYWLDAHSGRVPEPVMQLAADVIPRLPNLRAVIFEVLPIFVSRMGLDQVQVQLEQLHQLWDLRHADSTLISPAVVKADRNAKSEPNSNEVTSEAWEDTLGAIATGQPGGSSLFTELKADPGSKILQTLVESVRAGMVVDGLKLTCRLLMLQCGEVFFRQLLSDFWQTSPPQLFGSAEAFNFASYLATRQLDIPYLSAVLDFERAQLHEARTGETQIIHFPFDPVPLLQALWEGRLPDDLPQGHYQIAVNSSLGAYIRSKTGQ